MWMPLSGYLAEQPWLEALAAGCGFLAAYLLVWSLYLHINRERFQNQHRLKDLESRSAKKRQESGDLNKPFLERVGRPLLNFLAQKTGRLMPAKKKNTIQKKLNNAGNPGNLSPNEFLGLQYGITLAIGILWIFFTLPADWTAATVLIGMAGTMGIGFTLPEFYLKKMAIQRKDDITRGLPDVLDLLTVSVEAGLGFDAALHKVVDKTEGTVRDEFARTLHEVQLGKPRREALRDMSNRVNVEDLTTFVGAVIQADQLGVSIGNVLRLQSEQIRGQRRQRAEEAAMKAPIKMLIPLVFFIFPTIFIVLLGPAVIQMIETFGK